METFDRYGGKLLLQSRYSIKLLSLDNLPSFYTKILQYWQEIRNNERTEIEWKLIPMETFDRYGGKLLLQSRYSIKLLSLDNLPSFYTKILQFWQEIRNNERTEIDATNIVKEVIWNNRCIQINQKTVFFEKWYSKGILKIGGVIDENNNFIIRIFEKNIRH